MLNVQNLTRRVFALAAVFAILLLNGTQAFAQSQVSGTVTDQAGETLIGVTVMEKGTSNGVITDDAGRFTIQVAQGNTLVFSCVGFMTEEIAAARDMKVVLREDLRMLEEVVVVGYGQMNRKDVTSSITTVKSDDLNVGVYTSPAQLLQGKVPGLTIANTSDPNGNASISLRGASSLRSGAAMEPYYVIDGVPGVSLDLVAPEDIESIDVLRDASATAIYGSKAANGVIIVTTKKGSKNGSTNVNYSGYVAVDNVMKTLDMMTADELLAYAKKNNVDLSPYYDVNKPADTNWQKEVLRAGFSHNHNVSITGGNDKTSYSASLNYMDREGVVRGTEMDRLTARTFLQTKTLKDHLELSFGLNASVTNNQTASTGTQGQSIIDAMYYYSPLVPVKNEDGSWYHNSTISQNFNPMSMVHEDLYTSRIKKLQGIAKATLHIVDGLDWNANLSYEADQWINNSYNSTKSQLPDPSARHGVAGRNTSEDVKRQLETYVTYDKTFAEKHKLGLMAGYSWEQSDIADGFGATTYDFYNDKLSYFNLGLGNKLDQGAVWSHALSTVRMISFYGRFNYSFDSRYLLQATIRRDGSSVFGVNNRWGTFPSVSAAWRVTEEPFMESQNVFDDLKFRVGYGVSGNALGFGAYEALQTYGASGWFTYIDPASGTASNYHMLAANKNANPDLKWERTAMLNIGLDFGFFDGRLTGTVEYYDKRTKDLIYGYAVSTNRYPYGWMTANVGEISNKGVELTINAVPVSTRNFTWNTSLNLSHNKNMVERLSNDTYSVDYTNMANPDVGGYSTTTVQRIMEGAPIGQFYLWEWAGYNEDGGSVFNDYDEDGNLVGTTDAPDETDRRMAGSAQPKLTYGWNNTFAYKGLSLTAFFQGIAGNKIFNATRAYYNNVTLMNTGKNMLSEVATMQKATDTRAQAPSDRYLENGSYLRLATLSLGYDFGSFGDWVKNLKIYATCNNVFTVTAYKGVDPEISLGGLEPGMDWRNSTYPRTRTFMFGVNITF